MGWNSFKFGAPQPFCVVLSQSVHWHACFYIAVLSLFFFLGFRQWWSCAGRVVNLKTTIQPPLFWRTWSRARACTCPHVLAWHMGRDYSDCRASELTDCHVSGFVFFWNDNITIFTKIYYRSTLNKEEKEYTRKVITFPVCPLNGEGQKNLQDF